MANILIIDDDRVLCDMLSRRINRLGHHTAFVLTLNDGIELAHRRHFDVILLDVQLPDGNGIQAIPEFQELDHPPQIIIMTGSGDPDGAELSIKWGAWDYIEKPASVEAITLPITRALEYRKEKTDKETRLTLKSDEIIGNSSQMRSCLKMAAQAANTDINVLIQGETGTGKELLARAIHQNSKFCKEGFIIVDCGAIPESLVEGLLFGHEKGAFTGADKKQSGLVEQADNGTLFLDEIGELPLPIQKKFLRVLQERRFRPLGSKIEKESNFRLISATNKDLDQMVKENTFREDLLYRIRSFSLISPPLRKRSEDVSDLAMYYIARKCEKSGILTKGFSPDFFELVNTYQWPGNVRELFNALDSAMASAGEQPVLFPQHLPIKIRSEIAKLQISTDSDLDIVLDSTSFQTRLNTTPLENYKTFRNQLLDAGEKQYFIKVCQQAKGDTAEACKITDLSKSRLYFFLKKHGLSIVDFK